MDLASSSPTTDTKSAGGAGAIDQMDLDPNNDHELTSFNGAGPSIHGYQQQPLGDDLDPEDGTEWNRPSGTILAFFSSGTGLKILLLILASSFVGIVGGVGYALHLVQPSVAGIMSFWTFCVALSVFIGSLAVINLITNSTFRLFSLIVSWDWLHYAKETEGHLASMIWLIVWLVLTNIYFDRLLIHPLPQLVVDPKPTVMKLLVAGLVMTVCLAIKSHYMRSLAMTFNYENYRDRIEAALRTDRIIKQLWKSRHTYKFRKRVSKPTRPTINFWKARSSESASVKSSTDDQHFHSLPTSLRTPVDDLKFDQISNEDLKEGERTPRPDDKPKPLTEAEKKTNFVQFTKLAAKTMGMVASSGLDFRLENSREARKQANKLFKYMKPDGRSYVIPQDLRCYIEDESDYLYMIKLLKKSIKWQSNAEPSNDDFVITEKLLRKMIQGSLNELVMIMKSMQTIETALTKVDWIFSVAIIIVAIFGCSVLLGYALELLLAMTTCLSGAAFVFSTSAKNAFESLIFVIMIHPFDVGDRVYVNLNTFSVPTASTIPPTMSGSDSLDNLLVVEMHLLSTVLERWDGVRLYVPNYLLATKAIYNIRRSGPLIELQRIQISFDTPLSKISELRERLDRFVRADKTDFTDLSRVNFDAIESCARIHLNVIAQYNSNWQDLDKQLAFRSRFLMFIKQTLDDLEIGYLPPVQRIAFVDRAGKALEGMPMAAIQ